MKTSNLECILSATKQIDWSTETVRNKALLAVTSIFNLFIYRNIDLNQYRPLSQEFFKSIIKGKTDHINEIKSKLISNNILDTNNSYSVFKHKGKGFRFNHSTIQSIYTILPIPFIPSLSVCLPLLETLEYQGFQTEVFLPYLDKLSICLPLCLPLIEELSKIKDEDLKIGEEIENEFVTLYLNDKYRYGKQKALELAKTLDVDLIQFKDNFYLEKKENFKIRKTSELKMCYTKKVFDIENGCFYQSRNETNNRLDYNLTGFKKELFEYLKFDGENLVELDIANAQFAITAHLNPNIDTHFIELSQTGTLYDYIALKLNKTAKEAKSLMFRVAFDKVKSDKDFEDIRSLFPLFMQWVDTYKKDNGYKLFSNLLQKTESKLMIDGVFKFLIDNGYEIFPIHDAVRVKESQLEEIKMKMNEFFDNINFKCLLRDKNKTK